MQPVQNISYFVGMKLLFTLMLGMSIHQGFAQLTDAQFFYFDKDWKQITPDSATYLIRVGQTADSGYQWTYYNFRGPRIKQESFKDEKATIRNGKFTYYQANGKVDSAGEYINNLPEGTWVFYSEKGFNVRQKEYLAGVIIKDSAILEQLENQKAKQHPIAGEVESEYPGGMAAWARFMIKNLHYPDRAFKGEVMGDIVVQFIVDEKGNVQRPEIWQSVEYSLDEEALRIIYKSGQWVPASKDGKQLKSYKRQPIKFRMQ
jgi:protein TonB